MPSSDSGFTPRPRHEVLEQVYRDGARRRLRRRALAGGGAALAALAVAVAVVAAGTGRPTAVHTVDEPTTTTTTRAESTTTTTTVPSTTTTAAPATATTAPRFTKGEVIAYAQGNAVHTVHPDGSGDRVLLTEASAVSGLAWSPDGQFLAYSTGGDVYQVRRDGSARERLTSTPGIEVNPTWRPDGRALAFTAQRDGGWKLIELTFTMSTDRPERTLPVTAVAPEARASWSPEGDEIAVARDVAGKRLAYVFNVYTGQARRLTDRPDGAEELGSWSPDRKTVAFTTTSDGSLYTVAVADPHGWRRVGSYGTPAWSPDGRFMAVTGAPGASPSEVDVVTADGRFVRRVTPGAWPAWSRAVP